MSETGRTISADVEQEARSRIPPGQVVTEKFPVLHYGSVPAVDLANWDLRVFGLVEQPLRFT